MKAEHEEPLSRDRKIFSFQTTPGDKEGYPILVKRHLNQTETYTHEHVFHEIVLVESGSAQHQSCEGVRRVSAGGIIVIRPRIWHRYFQTKDFRIVNCLFDRRILLDQKVFLSLARGVFELFHKPVRFPAETPPAFFHANPRQRERLLETLDSMILERKEKHIDWQGALVALLLNLIIQISRMDSDPLREESLSDSNRNLANMWLLYIEEHFREDLSLSGLASHFHVSPAHISRIFKKRVGLGVVDYINHLRIDEACKLLRSTDWTAAQIAAAVGYAETPYFFRRFRRSLGKSPMEYRKLALK